MPCIPMTLHRQELTAKAVFAWVRAADHAALPGQYPLVLHPNELAYYEKIVAERRRTSFLLGRYAAKLALSALLPIGEPQHDEIEIASGIFQQPIVKFQTPEPFGVSISHTTEYACAIAFPMIHPMALDIERIDPLTLEAMKSEILTQELQSEILYDLPEPTRCAIIWTAKEALSKVLKCGMMTPFSIFETVDLSHDAPWYVGNFLNFGQYKFHAFIMKDHVLAFALPRRTTLELDVSLLPDSSLHLG